MKVFIIGIAGGVGRRVAERLAAAGDEPIGLVRRKEQAEALASVFPEAWRKRHMDASFEHYMVEKKKAETPLVLTDLDWLILRPSALTNEPGTGRVDLGLARVHTEIARDDVAATIVALLRTPGLSRMILELTGGGTAISEGIDALATSRAAAA